MFNSIYYILYLFKNKFCKKRGFVSNESKNAAHVIQGARSHVTGHLIEIFSQKPRVMSFLKAIQSII